MAEKKTMAEGLISKAFLPEEAARIFSEKVRQKPLVLRPTDGADARGKRRVERERRLAARREKQKPLPLTAREKRSLSIYDVPKEARQYALYHPLHQMWIGYIQEILFGEDKERRSQSLPITPTTAARLCSADFHGAFLEVVKARCPSRVGLKGIVIKDTKFTFHLITQANDVKVVPKEHAIFKFELPSPSKDAVQTPQQCRNVVFELHGSQFQNRAPDRANKKFKQRNIIDA